jgi:hypothetical protein
MDKTALTKEQKKKIKDARGTETYTDEEWAILQGMTHNEFSKPTEITPFFDAVDEKLKKK